MSLVQDFTPCPSPRPDVRSKLFSQALPARANPVTKTGKNLLSVRPRRPNRARGSLGWDPTVDIYDDTFALQRPEPSHEGNEDDQTGRQSTSAEPSASSIPRISPREVSRKYPSSSGSTIANIRIRRTSSSSQPQQGSPASMGAMDQGGKTANAEDDIRRQARRRTIYVPSDDTTIMTIHPGASIKTRNANPIRPRRSDIFLDLATLSEVGESQRQSQTFKRPLLAAPRRAPLQPSARQLQISAFSEDIPGSGGGKENIPPGTLLGGDKPKKLLASPVREDYLKPTVTSIAHSTSPSPQRVLVGKHVLDFSSRSPTVALRFLDHSPLNSSPRRSANGTSPSEKRPRFSLAKPTTLREAPKAALPLFSSPLSDSIRKEKAPQHLRMPQLRLSSAGKQPQYPVLSEDVSNPELYEDNWLGQQEVTITLLINSLFDTVGRGPHTQPSNAKSLRSPLVALHNTPSNVTLNKKLQASLRFGALSISNDTLARVGRFKDDVALRQKFLDLWLKTYDLALLQAAAEVVIGRDMIPSGSNSRSPSNRTPMSNPRHRVRPLETFLRAFLVSNEDGLPAKGTVSTTLSPARAANDATDDTGSAAWAWRRTVTRSLMLILLLDAAATTMTFTPQLFKTSSTHKSSSSVLKLLSSILLPSIGDTSRVLAHLSYQVTHVQYPLQEYTYQVRNLATDLRDGVLLTRLVETLLYPPSSLSDKQNQTITITLPTGDILSSDFSSRSENWPLTSHLKYPCQSRVQRLYNVQIVLSALEGVADIETMLEGVSAKDIVDGHREKTVALLWSIVSRWGLEALLDFSLVEQEITRLRGGLPDGKDREYAFDVESTPSEQQRAILLSWAQQVCKRHSVEVTNLSTSFSDGKAYEAMLSEYSTYIPGFASSLSSSSLSTITSSMNKTTKPEPSTITQTLRNLGISSSFSALFPAVTAGVPGTVITSSRTTVPVLTFLASRLLPVANVGRAVVILQRWWRRRKDMRGNASVGVET